MVGEKVPSNGFGIGKAEANQFYIEPNKDEQTEKIALKEF